MTKLADVTSSFHRDEYYLSHLTWSLERSTVAFGSAHKYNGYGGVFILRTDSPNNLYRAADTFGGYFALSPDGTRVAFLQDDEGTKVKDIHIADFNGDNRYQLTNNSSNTFSPKGSPDSKRITFTVHESTYTSKVYVIDVDGNNLHQLVNPDLPDNIVYSSWSPNGH